MSSPTSREQWRQHRAAFGAQELLINGFQVMQTWETGYMERLADIAVSRGGAILEVGFGLGLSAGFIQASRQTATHVVIESHPDVLAFARGKFAPAIQSGRLEIIPGFWEEVTPRFPDGHFDGILFDTCPLEQETQFFHGFPFFPEAFRLLKRGGVFTYFSDEATGLSAGHRRELAAAGFTRMEYEVIPVAPPPTCRYWRQPTLVAPIIGK